MNDTGYYSIHLSVQELNFMKERLEKRFKGEEWDDGVELYFADGILVYVK